MAIDLLGRGGIVGRTHRGCSGFLGDFPPPHALPSRSKDRNSILILRGDETASVLYTVYSPLLPPIYQPSEKHPTTSSTPSVHTTSPSPLLACSACDLLRLRLRLLLRRGGDLGRLPVQHDLRLLEVAALVCGWGLVSCDQRKGWMGGRRW